MKPAEQKVILNNELNIWVAPEITELDVLITNGGGEGASDGSGFDPLSI